MASAHDSGAESVDRNALLQEAKTQRGQNRPHDAIATLKRLQNIFPNFSRLYHELGHCFVQIGDAHAAITALEEAVRLNATLPMSWDMLEQLYRIVGDTANAAKAGQHLAMLQQLPPEMVVANSLYADGDLSPAETVIRDYLGRDGDNVGALRLLARLCLDRHNLSEAESLLETLLKRTPDFHAARLDYALVLLQQQKHLKARQQAEILLKHDPENRNYLKQFCVACIGLGDHEPVIDIYQKLLGAQVSGPEVADLRLWRGNALKICGRADEAIADYKAALIARPDYGVAWFSLANFKTYQFSDDEMARMQAFLDRSDAPDLDRIYLSFALGKAFEDRCDYAASWQYYEGGNRLRCAASSYRPEVAQNCAAQIKQIYTSEFFATRSGWGVTDADPIFILGLPRSGSTLIEQILASHSHVEGTQELTEIDRYMAEICGRDQECRLPLNPNSISSMTADEARALGNRFLDETRTYRRLGRPFFIDKMPNNFWHIGLIQLILPRATIIDVRREPMSCCFSNLKQLFGTTNQEFTYGVPQIAHYYRTYLELMRHWDNVLPGRVIRVSYEDVVEDTKGSIERLLELCRLGFDPQCLAFHKTQRSIRTPSSEQVRQPINRDGMEQWHHYEPWLGALKEALGDALTQYRT